MLAESVALVAWRRTIRLIRPREARGAGDPEKGRTANRRQAVAQRSIAGASPSANPVGDEAMTKPTTSSAQRRMAAFAFAAFFVAAILICVPGAALAQDLQSQLSQKRSQLQQDRSQQAALSTTIERYSSQIAQLSAEVATLHDRQAKVQQQLDVKEAQLRRARARLARLRTRLHAALKVLRQRLVATYESDQPDVLTVILDAHGFNQLSSRYEYLQSIQDQDTGIVTRVRGLRNQTRDTVNRIHAARDRLATERDQLARTQTQLQARKGALAAAHARKQRVLSQVRSNGQQLQSEITAVQGRIEAAQAAQAPVSATSASGATAPTAAPLASQLGPVPAGQAISPFPASSPLAWGRTDQGVDGTTAPGSPLLAMGSGTVTIGHDPAGFGASYPIIHTSFGDFYYGHCVPTVADGASVSIGQPIATAHYRTWGNSTTPGGFEIGAWPPGDMAAGGAIRSWLIGLPRR
jgi:peptidoglycan hydrolase CwlO-like protein